MNIIPPCFTDCPPPDFIRSPSSDELFAYEERQVKLITIIFGAIMAGIATGLLVLLFIKFGA